jgi:hypothetical protein
MLLCSIFRSSSNAANYLLFLRLTQPFHDFRVNGCYVGFWFHFTKDNLLAMTGALRRKLWRPAEARPPREHGSSVS